MKKFRNLLFYCFIVLLLLAAFGGLWFYWATRPAVTARQPVLSEQVFVIPKGEATSSIIKRLQKQGLVRSSLALNLILYQQGLVGKIQAGDFRINQEMTAWEIVQALTHGTIDQQVTLIEGWRAEEIAVELDLPAAAFKPEEGYLFPDTYLIPKDASPAAVISILKKNFVKKTDPLLTDIQKSGLTLKQTLILASLVEREARNDESRAIIAGILIKRWQNDWPLQVDATVQYALGQENDWWPIVSRADLKIKSPYNTYLYKGLPPDPICSPGLASIKAVVYPEETDYWFYISDQQGQMHYGRTSEEHTANIQKYL